MNAVYISQEHSRGRSLTIKYRFYTFFLRLEYVVAMLPEMTILNVKRQSSFGNEASR